MNKRYFEQRLIEELKRAEESSDPGRRAAHLEACRHYRNLLELGDRRHG
jgi:hypothetical protein